ncbi:MAG: hypothetical protein QOH05_3405 [Acetobacteraceae bacterium]|jgi:hypothetical protein|nr:hypothetical protein [Acetobacteraceae bacterium]
MTWRAFALAALLWAVLSPARAAEADRIGRDCYAATHIAAPGSTPSASIFVFVDETTLFDDRLKQEAIDEATGFLAANRSFAVGRFSAFVQGRYADITTTGGIQPNLTDEQRYVLPRTQIRDFDVCYARQAAAVKQGIGEAVLGIMNNATSEIVRSDIMTSLQGLSKAVQADPSSRKVVLVVSDMLENSSIASFYEKGGLGTVGDDAIKTAAKAHAFGDFGGAEVYVLGAAVIPAEGKPPGGSYRDPKKLDRLERFWSAWFQSSNAKLVAFGKPTLAVPIK